MSLAKETKKIIVCKECGTETLVNLGKRVFSPKYCKGCKAVIVNARGKITGITEFQLSKLNKREITRERFAQRLRFMKVAPQEIARRMVRVFEHEQREIDAKRELEKSTKETSDSGSKGSKTS
jgi:GTP-sensing pleiotropic transcriptional regulator CodY